MSYSMRTTSVVMAGLLTLAVLLLAAGCVVNPVIQPAPAKSTDAVKATAAVPESMGKAVTPMEMRLTLADKPALGCPLTVTLMLKPQIAAPNMAITVTLPAELELVGGALTWQGDVGKDEAKQISFQVRVAVNGYYSMKAYATFNPNPGSPFPYPKAAWLYFVVDGAEGWAGEEPPKNNWVANNVGVGGLPVPPGTEQIIAHAYLTRPLEWGQETDLIYEITPTADINHVEIGFVLPVAGLAVVERENPRQKTFSWQPSSERKILGSVFHTPMSWEGMLVKNDQIVIRVRLKPTTTGEGAIIAYTSENRPGGSVLLHKEILRLSVYRPDRAE
ncbi:MAG: hypothetical protein CVU38_20160 [Chloroflexi bacterium HGW-Chloroflexi-1]|nr:MAG: hypothetical protein CVU38_20160 [Chloroflexi bacterium HGW-Chloroflexi-1]